MGPRCMPALERKYTQPHGISTWLALTRHQPIRERECTPREQPATACRTGLLTGIYIKKGNTHETHLLRWQLLLASTDQNRSLARIDPTVQFSKGE